MGGFGDGATLWDSKTQLTHRSELVGNGPVCFSANGTPIQLVAESPWRFKLWDVSRQQLVRELTVPRLVNAEIKPGEPLPSMALTPDGSLAIVSPKTSNADKVLAVFETATGALLHEIPIDATALAVSPDAAWLAAGNSEGQITICRLPAGKEVITIAAGRNAIQALAFGRDCRPRLTGKSAKDAEPSWLLAAGEAGGAVTVWDLQTSLPRAFCHGSEYDVYTIAFSPDGQTLATAGRNHPKLWDVATGRLLLNLDRVGFATGICFSRAGKQLALSTTRKCQVWNLDFGRRYSVLSRVGRASRASGLFARWPGPGSLVTKLAAGNLGCPVPPFAPHTRGSQGTGR